MSVVSAEFLARWRQEIQALVGGNARRIQRPVAHVYIRRGYFKHGNEPWDGPEINAYVVGGDNDEPWQKTYFPLTDWIEVPNVQNVDLNTQLDTRGATANVLLKDVYLREESGLAGLYHAVERGWLSPWRGTETEFTLPAPSEENEWFRLLDQKVQIKIWQGYGEDEIVPTFLGFVDDLDMTSMPDNLTIMARDAAQVASDQRFYGWSKEVSHPDPVTFADRTASEDITRVGTDPDASSEQAGHEASMARDGDSDTAWWSDDSAVPNFTEWLEIEIPAGRYESIRLNTEGYGGMTCYVAVYSVDGTVDGVPVADGWIDGGLGTVPGANGGFEYVKTFTTVGGAQTKRLPFVFIGGDGSKLRVAFRDLKAKGDDYRAGVVGFAGLKRELPSEDFTDGWILVDDVSDIVRLILRWCGFKEWYVEDANMRVNGLKVINRTQFLMDMIDEIVQETGFIFYIADPSADDDSLGYPVFRMNSSLRTLDAEEVPVIKDTDLLKRAQTRFTSEPLAHIIRVRGRHATKDEGGIVLSRDARRLVAVYRPPWAHPGGGEKPRTASIYGRTFLDRFWIKTQELLDYTARLVALYQALASGTALIETPANPAIELDSHVLLQDTGTGLNTRMWVDARASSWSGGTDPKWVMTLNGSLLDTPYMELMREEVRSFMGEVES